MLWLSQFQNKWCVVERLHTAFSYILYKSHYYIRINNGKEFTFLIILIKGLKGYNRYMYFKSKKTSLLILGITSVICSRTMLLSLNDPEGPNLLVVMGMAAIIYFLSLTTYLFNPSITGFKRLLLVIFVQVIITTILYFLLN